MRLFGVLLAVGLALGGCAGDRDLLSQVPQSQGVVRADYQTLASCVASKTDDPGMTKIDLPPQKTSKLSMNSGGVRYWEATFRGIGQNTEWSVTSTNSMWGPLEHGQTRVVEAIKACT